MATSIGGNPRQAVPVEGTNGLHEEEDPFALETPAPHPHPHRFSSFDTQLFALNHPSSSPAQAKKALEAHLAETDRRIQETSKLGTTLVQQRVNLSQRLRDVGTQEDESQITPELRQKLVEIEREYNEVGKQSAKAFLGPKASTQGDGHDTPFALDGRVRHSRSEWKMLLTQVGRILRALPNSPAKLLIHPPKSTSQGSSGTKHLRQMILNSQQRSQHLF